MQAIRRSMLPRIYAILKTLHGFVNCSWQIRARGSLEILPVYAMMLCCRMREDVCLRGIRRVWLLKWTLGMPIIRLRGRREQVGWGRRSLDQIVVRLNLKNFVVLIRLNISVLTVAVLGIL